MGDDLNADAHGKIAVSAATYSIDRPFDYLVPEALRDAALPGTRVSLPFGKGNRRCEGVILSVADKSERENLKCIDSVLDPAPVLDEELIKLAFFIRDRFFCTVYDAVKAMLPAGLWFTDDGKRRVNDKTVEMVRLAIPSEDAARSRSRGDSGRRNRRRCWKCCAHSRRCRAVTC